MNRKERRRLQKQGIIPKQEPSYRIKPSELKDAVLNGPGEKALRHEINQQCLEADKGFTLDTDTMWLWTLHKKYGWGKKRLRQLYLDVFEEHLRMRHYYEMDDLYPERYKLKEKGVDVEAWYNELFDEYGNFKRREEIPLWGISTQQ